MIKRQANGADEALKIRGSFTWGQFTKERWLKRVTSKLGYNGKLLRTETNYVTLRDVDITV